MESFSLLKYWRGTGGVAAVDHFSLNTTPVIESNAIVSNNPVQTDDDDDNDGDDDGPFFDLEFAVPDEDESLIEEGRNFVGVDESEDGNGNEDEDEDENEGEEDGDTEGEREFKFTLSSGSSNDHSDANLTFSPSDDLFFKGKLVPVEPSSLNEQGSEPNSKPQLHLTLLKSAAKFRVFMSGLKKSKPNPNGDSKKTEPQVKEETLEEKNENPSSKSKFFSVKFKVEEVPIVSLFTRDNSSRATPANNTITNNKSQKQISSEESISEENRFSKDVMQKYLKMVKPLYIRVSRRYGEKFKFSGQLVMGAGNKTPAPLPPPPPPPPPSTEAPPTSAATVEKSVTDTEAEQVQIPTNNTKGRNMPAKLRVVCKHLGKSRSASSAVAAVPPGPAPSRRDDSLLQQQDGIQGAILHCKRSFNASRDSETSLLSRSVSDIVGEKKTSDLTEKAIV